MQIKYISYTKYVSMPNSYLCLPLLPAAHGKEPGRGNTVVPEHGRANGLGGDALKVGFPGMQLNGIPGPRT